jgi:aromatic-L-amino-acid decarboxylase
MPPEEFRRHGHEVVDWIADYLANLDAYPVMPTARPGEIRGALGASAPLRGEPMADLLRDFRDVVVPGINHWNHPAFHGYFSVTGSGPGILGEMLSAALNVNAMVWRSSPAGTEVEELALDWLRDMVGLPEAFRGTINDTASVSSLVALTAARERAFPESRLVGLGQAPRGRVYASSQAHSSIDKACVVLGLGREGIRHVAVDERYAMEPDALRAAVTEDMAAGVRPVAVVATVGTTSTTSVDPVARVADLAEELGLWLHVDAAYAGPAAVLPELRHHFVGWERADSVVLNPHKWLFTPVDCSALYYRDPEAIRTAFSLTPEYLRTAEEAVATNLMDYGVALGRRFRGLKLWFVLRYFGQDGIAERIREHVRLARLLADRADADTAWERVAPVPFSTVVLRYAPDGMGEEAQDRLTEAIMERVNATGRAFLSHTKLRGRFCLRVSIGNLRTTEEHVLRVWRLLREAAAEVHPEGAGR